MNAMSQIFYVLRGNAGHRNSSVLGEEDAEVLAQARALVCVHAREAEHADLVGDVLPVSLGAETLEILPQSGSDGDDSISHQFYVAKPLSLQIGSAQDGANDASAMNRWVRVHWSDENL